MLKMLELAAPHSCLNRADPEEPLFVLRANDPLFAATIRHWAAMSHGMRNTEKINEALETAALGHKWREDRQPKDVPAAEQVYRSGAFHDTQVSKGGLISSGRRELS